MSRVLWVIAGLRGIRTLTGFLPVQPNENLSKFRTHRRELKRRIARYHPYRPTQEKCRR